MVRTTVLALLSLRMIFTSSKERWSIYGPDLGKQHYIQKEQFTGYWDIRPG